LPQCSLCGTKLPWGDLNAIYHEGKLVCPRCSVLAKIKSPRFLPIPVVPPAAPMQEPSASEKRKRRINIATSFVSLLGLAVIDFGVFYYLPQYSTWAVVGTAALLAIYHPWWRHGIDKSKYDKILMDGQWLFVKKNSWRPVWVCESCNKMTIDQIETGQMLPCRNCGHENESFLPNFWNGTDAVTETDRDRPRWVIVSDDLMGRRESASR